MIENTQMSESTIQFVIKLFSILVSLVTLGVVGTFAVIVIRDGNDPLVQTAFNDLADLASKAFFVIPAVIVGKPVATGIGNFMQGKALQASTSNVPIQPVSLTAGQAAPGPAGPSA